MPVYVVEYDSEYFRQAEEIIDNLPEPEVKDVDIRRSDPEELSLLMGLADHVGDDRIARDSYRVNHFSDGEVILATTENYYLVDTDDVLSDERPGLVSAARKLEE